MILRYSTSPAPKPSTTITFAEIKARFTQANKTMTTLEIKFPDADLAALSPIIETIARCRGETPDAVLPYLTSRAGHGVHQHPLVLFP